MIQFLLFALYNSQYAHEKGGEVISTITTQDGTHIYYKEWGTGQPVVFSHGWPLNADAWESQMVFLASNGYRTVAHDRRGHGLADTHKDQLNGDLLAFLRE